MNSYFRSQVPHFTPAVGVFPPRALLLSPLEMNLGGSSTLAQILSRNGMLFSDVRDRGAFLSRRVIILVTVKWLAHDSVQAFP